jgi:four helix bundle protein
MSRYEKLHAWRECHELALAVYRVTKRFPDDERYGLASQTRRAAFSAAANIVEDLHAAALGNFVGSSTSPSPH